MTQLAPAGFLALLALACGYGYYGQRRRLRAMAETERTRADQVIEGPVELRGTVEPIETVTSPVDGSEAVVVDWDLDADPADEDSTHDNVISGRRAAVFEVADEGGRVRVDPTGATLRVSGANTTSEHTQAIQSDRIRELDDAVQGDHGGTDREGVQVRANGTLRAAGFRDRYDSYTLRHEVLRPGDEAYVLGTAVREDGDLVVGDGKTADAADSLDRFLVSDMAEEELSGSLRRNARILLALAGAFAVGAAYFLLVA